MFDAGYVQASDLEDTGKASALSAEGLQVGFERDSLAKIVFDASYVQASDLEDTGKASGTRNSQQVQEPRANARRLMKSRNACEKRSTRMAVC